MNIGARPTALFEAPAHWSDPWRITVPLDEPRCATDDAMRVVLDDLTRGRVHEHFGTEIKDRSFNATDIVWSFGTGVPVSGTAAELALSLCGRRL